MTYYLYSFEKLEVWQLAKAFAIAIYSLTAKFPKEEKYGLISQVNRATISIASNLAEGSARKTKKDKAHFYNISYGSLVEVASLLLIAKDLSFIDDTNYNILRRNLSELSNKINALHNSQVNSLPNQQLNDLTNKQKAA